MSILDPALLTELRELQVELAWPDTYQIVGTVSTRTPTGGWADVEQVVESGACKLREVNTNMPTEREIAERQGWTVPYAVDLPHNTTLTPEQKLKVNGREMQVGGVLRGGAWALKATAVAQEQG